MSSNWYANRLSLVNTTSALSTSIQVISTSPTITTGTITSTANFVIQISAQTSNLYIGACFLTGSTYFTILGNCSSTGSTSGITSFVADPTGGEYYLISIAGSTGLFSGSATYAWQNPTTVAYPSSSSATAFQDLFSTFLVAPTELNYSLVAASAVYFNNLNNFFTSGKGRILLALDDGTVIFDSSKCTISSTLIVNLGSNTYLNFSTKVKVTATQSNISSTNTLTSANTATAAGTITFTVGTAGGNLINENHNTRPEILLAMLSSSGVGFANRYSTSVNSFNYYYAVRIGNVSEQNLGTLRVNIQATV